MIKKKKVIVIFDSGLGGLTVMSEIFKSKINEHFVYLADNKNAPYGNKTKQNIKKLLIENLMNLNRLYDFKAIVLACNTAAVNGLQIVKDLFNVPVFSVTKVATDFLRLNYYLHGTVDVLATQATVTSRSYSQAFPKHYVKELPCPDFVPLIESYDILNPQKRKEVVIQTLIGKNTKTVANVILGCTHYPYIQNEIQDFYGDETNIINPSTILVETLKEYYLESSNHFNVDYFLTQDDGNFTFLAKQLTSLDIQPSILNHFSHTEVTVPIKRPS